MKTIYMPENFIEADAPTTPIVSVDEMNPAAVAGSLAPAPWQTSILDGDKFVGGFGATQLQFVDYWTLRARSAQLFNENIFARGLIRRLVTNEINTGLTPESMPDESILGLPIDTLNDWTETVENRFELWGKNPRVCDWKKADTFGSLQRMVRREALVNGDILVVLRVSPVTGLPQVQLVSGNKVQTPLLGGHLENDNDILHGVETDKAGRVVAYHIRKDDGEFERMAAFGARSKRRVAWLVFGTDKRLDDVRGQPLLALVLQSLKEIDRYRDATTRKAVINSILAMFIQKDEEKMGTLPMTGGATRVDQLTGATTADGSGRNFTIAQQHPGMIIEELNTGEKPVGFNNAGIDEKYGDFEEAMIQGVAWACEIPPEILRLSFSNNYSASQAAINEFKIYLNMVWSDFGETFCTPIYQEWLISEALQQRVATPAGAPDFIQAWRDPRQYDTFGAWVSVTWYGSIKPSTDMLKQVKASAELIRLGLSTYAREARITTGTKFSKNVQRVKRENEQLAEAQRPLLELAAEFGNNEEPGGVEGLTDRQTGAVLEIFEDIQNE